MLIEIPIIGDLIVGIFDVLIACFNLLKSIIWMLPPEACIVILVTMVFFAIKFIPFIGD